MTRVAAIDCGTNSIRLLVADVPDAGAHTDLLRRMEVVRLGQGVDATGRLAPEAIERTRVVLAEYAAAARDLGATAVRMVGDQRHPGRGQPGRTSRTWCWPPWARRPTSITGREEAELSFLGATASLDAAAGRTGAPAAAAVPGRRHRRRLDRVRARRRRRRARAPARSTSAACGITERHLHGDPPTAERDRAGPRTTSGPRSAEVTGRGAGRRGGEPGRPGRLGDDGRRARPASCPPTTPTPSTAPASPSTPSARSPPTCSRPPANAGPPCR